MLARSRRDRLGRRASPADFGRWCNGRPGCFQRLRDDRAWTTAAVAATASASWWVVMAFSRLYLGVHDASGVTAGLLAGVARVVVCVSALEVLRRRTGGARRV